MSCAMPAGPSLATTSWTDAMNLRDARLERSIQIASLEAYAAQSPEERRTAWERLKRLIAARSPEVKREIAKRRLDESEPDND